jgi:hypothetical protein
MATARLPFVCSNCGHRYGDSGSGPSLLAVEGDASSITVSNNWMQCPRCKTMNRQALPDGEYSIEGGKWRLVHRIAREILAANATQADFDELARLVQLSQTAAGAEPEQIAAEVERIGPFGHVARIIRENPDRALAILGIILSVVLWLSPPPVDWSGPPPSPPAQVSSKVTLTQLSKNS